MNEDNTKRLENFFKYNLKVKSLINRIIPSESDFYNDECNKYSSDGNVDMTLYERKKTI